MVECPARMLTLTSAACVADFQRVLCKTPEPWESRWHCQHCALGAERAGLSVLQTLPKGICVRCHREGLRIVTHAGLCVSCYNRQHELEAGKNGKGMFPTVTSQRYRVHAQVISIGDDGSHMFRCGVRHTASVLEGILSTLRVSHSVQVFGRAATSAGPQDSFWGGV